MQKRHKVTNDTNKPLLVFTEPIAEDYWLKPGESFEVVAEVQSSVDDFIIGENSDGYTFFPSNGMSYISVWRDGEKLECGHQRHNWS